MDIAILLTVLVNGLCTGGVFGITASAFTFQLGALRIVNFSYGALLMLAMYGVFFLVTRAQLPLALTAVICIPIFTFVGWVLRKFLITSTNDNVQILITMGILIVFENLALFLWGSFPRSLPIIEEGVYVGGIYVGLHRLMLLIISATILLGVHLFLNRTWLGMAIRAMVQSRDAAMVVGINVERISTLAFAFSSGLLAIAAALLMMLFSVEPASGGYYLLIGFLVAVLGGMGNLWGSLLAGLIIGVISGFAIFFSPGLHDVVLFLAFVLTLLFRPYGIFGTKEG